MRFLHMPIHPLEGIQEGQWVHGLEIRIECGWEGIRDRGERCGETLRKDGDLCVQFGSGGRSRGADGGGHGFFPCGHECIVEGYVVVVAGFELLFLVLLGIFKVFMIDIGIEGQCEE